MQGVKAKAPKAALGSHNAGGKGKTIEETYQKLSQLEHILLRPDTYIGSTEKQQQQLWVHDGEAMALKTITYAPGLYKIFDEILVNAADNKVRDSAMDTLRVDVDVVSTECVPGCTRQGPGRPAGRPAGARLRRRRPPCGGMPPSAGCRPLTVALHAALPRPHRRGCRPRARCAC